MSKPLIIVGPQESGKTKNAASFLQVFGCSRLVDDWDGKAPLKPGDLALTNVENVSIPYGCKVLSFVEAMQYVRPA